MELIIVTGFSGAGKSRAIDALEDIGFYCADNMPPSLIPKFAEICMQSGDNFPKVAIVTDARGGDFFDGLFDALDKLTKHHYKYKILFLEASEEVLINRYKETRRKHPLIDSSDSSVEFAVKQEHEILLPVRGRADYIIDTSLITPAQLKERITSLFLGDASQGLSIHCMSFGFKYGGMSEADMVFDVRFLPNPYYIDTLKKLTGLNSEVRDYVLSFPQTTGFIEKFFDMIDYLVPLFINEGKSQLVIGIGCTGGKHRSVTLTEQLYKHLSGKGLKVTINHRDIDKGR